MAATGSLLRFAWFGLALLLVALLLSFPAAAGLVAIRRSGAGGWASAAGLGAHDDLGVLAQLVGAVDHDAIAGLQPREHLDPVAFRHAELDRAHGDGAVLLEQIDEGAGHAALD